MNREEDQQLSLFGGPLYWLGCRLGLVRGTTNTLWLGLALGLLPWSVLVLFAIAQGFGPGLFSLSMIAIHVRFLVAIPLLFLCERWVIPQMAEFSRYIVRSGLVREASLPTLQSDLRRIGRMKDSWLAEALFLLVVFVLPMIEPMAGLPGKTGSWASVLHATGGRLSWTSAWYLGFCLPLFRFLLLRWLWTLGLWCYFLRCVARLELHLVPTHSDSTAGLGYLELVQENFASLAFAISAVYAAQFEEAISSGTMVFENLYPLVPMTVILIVTPFIGPLFLFAPKLWYCRWTGMSEYMNLASRYVTGFDSKWIRGENPTGEALLGSSDVQSLADLTNSINVIRGMRPIPASQRLVLVLAAAAILPMLPLALLKFPIDQLAARLFQMLTGL